MMVKSNKLVNLIMICLFTVFLSGCGENISGDNAVVELVEPVGVGERFVKTQRMDMTEYKKYNAVICPKVTEIAFDNAQTFDKYGPIFGENVNKGTTIIYGSTEALDKKIEDLENLIEALDDSYNEYIEDNKDLIYKTREQEEDYQDIVERLNDSKPSENSADYKSWLSQYQKYTLLLAQTSASLQKQEQTKKEKEELYSLDKAYNLSKLEKLKNKRKEALLSSDRDGVVVATSFYSKGDYIAKDSNCVAIGDLTSLEIKTEYISQSTMNKAKEYYALINGERYDVEYQDIDSEEYKRLLALNEVVYTTFTVSDPSQTLMPGDFAVIVLVNNESENALVVPEDAVYKDDSGKYVYEFIDGTFMEKPVKTGIKSGKYIEITQGLDDNSYVLSDEYIESGKENYTLSKGDINVKFSGNGYLYYSKTEWITNPVENGITYIDELLVSKYEHVSKGQVIAKIRVKSDAIEMARLERNIMRENEALNELIKDNDSEGKNDKLIKNKTKAIEELNDTLSKMKKDSITKEIKAPYNGIITNVKDFEEGDILQNEASVVEISDDTSSYIIVEDDSNQLSFGNIATIEFNTKDGKKKCEGQVVSANGMSLGKSLNQGYAIISIPPESLGDIAGSTRNNEGWWNRTTYKVEVLIHEMDNVILIPKKAVSIFSDVTYVKIKDSDGNYRYKSFIAGGADSANYWAISGLSEGMEICLE